LHLDVGQQASIAARTRSVTSAAVAFQSNGTIPARMVEARPPPGAHPPPHAAVAATDRGRRAPERGAGGGLREAPALLLG